VLSPLYQPFSLTPCPCPCSKDDFYVLAYWFSSFFPADRVLFRCELCFPFRIWNLEHRSCVDLKKLNKNKKNWQMWAKKVREEGGGGGALEIRGWKAGETKVESRSSKRAEIRRERQC